jgi:hypothetical protein
MTQYGRSGPGSVEPTSLPNETPRALDHQMYWDVESDTIGFNVPFH